MTSKIVAVFGSTGAQGFGVVESILETYQVRAFTRSPEKLKHLAHPNLTVIQLDLGDSATLAAALKGVWAFFVNTFSDDSQPEGAEEQLGKSIVDAAAEGGVEWLIYSGCEHTPYRAFKEKANVVEYARTVARKSGFKCIFPEV